MRRALFLIIAMALAGCGEGDMSDLRQFVETSGAGMRGKVPPLPEVKPYVPFEYVAFDLPDPFKPRKMETPKGEGGGGGRAPDLSRPREPLEAYPLENLRMVGTLEQAKRFYALIKAPDNTLFRVEVGNYMGQNFGKVTEITEAEVKLAEIVQDSAGDWAERSSALLLAE